MSGASPAGAPEALARLAQGLMDAWNGGDAAAFAGLFHREAHYVGGDGVWRRGRAAIEELRRSAGSTPPVALEGPVAGRFHDAVASLVFRWSTRGETGPQRSGVISCVVLFQDGEPRIEILHNTDSQ